MFKGFGNFAEMLKQASRLKQEMERADDELKRVVVEGSSGGGMVRVRMNGKQEMLGCEIDAQLVAERDAEMIGDLVTLAVNQAGEKARAAVAERFARVTGGMNLPGLPEMLGGLNGGPEGITGS